MNVKNGATISGDVNIINKLVTPSLTAEPRKVTLNSDLYMTGHTIYADYLTGGAYCLKDNAITPTRVPSNSTLTGKVGNPVWFYDGRPYELTSVNMAEKAKTLVNSSGVAYNVGNGIERTSPYGKTYRAVFFKNGVPKETNVIDYAEHAYWSDLGERYLGD